MAESDHRIAVVIMTYNRRKELMRTLRKLNEIAEHPKIVVVDNGSSDQTAEAVGKEFPNVEVLALKKNLGAVARTAGALRVSQPYIAFCDDDSWWRSGDLARAADLFDKHPRLAVINGQILVGPNEEVDPLCDELVNSPLPSDGNLPGPRIMGFLAGMAIIRRSAYLDVGGFNRRIFLCGEEEWLAADLAAHGWQLCYVPELIVHHHPSTSRNRHNRRAEGIRNTLWFTWLRRPPHRAMSRTLRLLTSLPRDWTSLHGLMAALLGLPRMLTDYRMLPADVEQDFCLLDAPQLTSKARRYIS